MTTLTPFTMLTPLDADDTARFAFAAGANNDDRIEAMADVDADFVSMDTLSVQAIYRGVDRANDTLGLQCRIMDGATVLAAANSGGTFQGIVNGITETVDTTSAVISFSYINTSANKSAWIGANVELRQRIVQSQGPDNAYVEVNWVGFTGTYTAGGLSVTVGTVTETDTIQPINAGALSVTVGAVTETDTVQAVNAGAVSNDRVVAHQVPYNKDPSDFNNWAALQVGAGAITIAGDGKSVTFDRDVPGDTANLRQYLEFDFGPWADIGDLIGVSARVTAVTKQGGTNAANLGLIGSVSAVDSNQRTIDLAGLYGMVLTTTAADVAGVTLRIGIGVVGPDVICDEITFSDIQVTRLEAGAAQPDTLVSDSFLKYYDNQPTLNGVIVGANNDTYDSGTGLITESPFTPVATKTMRHGLFCGDSWVASIQTTLGFRWISQYPGWIVSADGIGGRQLLTISTTSNDILNDLLAVPTPVGAEAPTWLVVTAGGNDMLNNGKDEVQLQSYDQDIYDWCVANNLYYVKVNMPPIAGAAAWQPSMRAITDNYNAALASNPFGPNFKVVDVYSALDDPGNPGSMLAAYDSGDGVHATYDPAWNAQAGADVILDEIHAVLNTLTPLSATGPGLLLSAVAA